MIKIVAVGKVREKYMIQAIDEYKKRLQPYTKLEIIEVPDVPAPQTNSPAQNEEVKKAEGLSLLSKIKDDEYVVALDLHGKDYDSKEISDIINDVQLYHQAKLTFVIAGSLGYSDDVVKRANKRWKLSSCTFPHQIVRLLLIEQVYRGFKILKNEPYHK